ncbi:peroxiredoxin [Aureococcus anophagefferens]|nr:peroxiredoxin [Aureococcus anophagefferens]
MALLGRRAAALTPVSSHRLSDQTESPNVPGLNACPATPPAKARSKRRGRGGALEGAEGGERWAFAACLAVGSGLWSASTRSSIARRTGPRRTSTELC